MSRGMPRCDDCGADASYRDQAGCYCREHLPADFWRARDGLEPATAAETQPRDTTPRGGQRELL